MAESVDALVSNTSGAIRAGSTPAQGTKGEIFAKRISPFVVLGYLCSVDYEHNRRWGCCKSNIYSNTIQI